MDGLFNEANTAGKHITLPISDTIEIELAWCPPGDFIMGTPPGATLQNRPVFVRNEPLIPVKLTKGFWIGCSPITEAQWQAVMLQNSYSGAIYTDLNVPASELSWAAAQDFCRKLTHALYEQKVLSGEQRFELPTEAQWEYACRAGTQTLWYFGDESDELSNYAWYKINSKDVLHSVRLKQPNSWGLYDMYGNVYEWCLDDDVYYRNTQSVVDPLVRNDGFTKIVRGGCITTKPPDLLRSASRFTMDALNSYNFIVGMRPVCIDYAPHQL